MRVGAYQVRRNREHRDLLRQPHQFVGPKKTTVWLKLHRDAALVEQGGTCFYCYDPLPRHKATADHRLARSRHGSDTRENIVAACTLCNEAKGSMTERSFMKLIKTKPTIGASLPVMMIWMRRRLELRTRKACERIDALVA